MATCFPFDILKCQAYSLFMPSTQTDATASMTFTFDGSTCTIKREMVRCGAEMGFTVDVREGDHRIILESVDGSALYTDAVWNTAGNVRAKAFDAWTADRICYMFSLAARRLSQTGVHGNRDAARSPQDRMQYACGE
jgi:hypothetical protein